MCVVVAIITKATASRHSFICASGIFFFFFFPALLGGTKNKTFVLAFVWIEVERRGGKGVILNGGLYRYLGKRQVFNPQFWTVLAFLNDGLRVSVHDGYCS